jgi:hypothetical protein
VLHIRSRQVAPDLGYSFSWKSGGHAHSTLSLWQVDAPPLPAAFGQRAVAPSGLSPFLSTATATAARSFFQCDTSVMGHLGGVTFCWSQP